MLAVGADAVVFTHFVAINVMVAAASAEHALIVFAPSYASCTVIDVDARALTVVQLGGQADTDVR